MSQSYALTSSQFIGEVREICWNYNPEIDESSSFMEVLAQLHKMKDSALKMELIESTIKEPQLPNFAEQRQGQL
tara:strand:- start:1758 stop:1979 length:222 start_codon:yes stop_codon:yes gene_type:complete